MRLSSKYLMRAGVGILLTFLFCEYLIYYLVQYSCDWPHLNEANADSAIAVSNKRPVRVLVLADTHLLGFRNGHWFDKLRREWQMHRAFQTAISLHQPELVFVLGDITDEGLWCSSEEFNEHVQRFYRLFKVPESTQLYVTAGNHDMGFHYGISPYLNQRFVTAFNAPNIQVISVRDVHFVLVNSMALEGDGCFLCRPVEKELDRIERFLKCSANRTSNSWCKSITFTHAYSRPILMQHYPLYRKSDADCKDEDAAPLSDRRLFQERWDCVSKEATMQLMRQLSPRVAFSGHTHHGCTHQLPNRLGTEYTISSFSWRNRNNPSYALVIFTANNYAFSKCAMPQESTVINVYIVSAICLTVWALYCLAKRDRKRPLKLS